ncbi:carboxypeptidase regulatory-like domain-containing protein [bacterium]|nr:carboxypeptidase regulatory-like domain-containing protein [bacterium]
MRCLFFTTLILLSAALSLPAEEQTASAGAVSNKILDVAKDLEAFRKATPKAEKKEKHVNPSSYDDIADGELYWGDWDGSIMGRVIDKYKVPIPFAKVKVHSKDLETHADKDGYFQIDGLQVGGHYSLIISARGMEPGVARWIPIPVVKVAKIGDFSIETEKVWTNFWVVTTNTVVTTELDALSNSFEKVTTLCLSNYYDVVEGETNVYDYSQWYFRFHLNYLERRVLEALGITNVPLAKKELMRRNIGFSSNGRPLDEMEEETEKAEEEEKSEATSPEKEAIKEEKEN